MDIHPCLRVQWLCGYSEGVNLSLAVGHATQLHALVYTATTVPPKEADSLRVFGRFGSRVWGICLMLSSLLACEAHMDEQEALNFEVDGFESLHRYHTLNANSIKEVYHESILRCWRLYCCSTYRVDLPKDFRNHLSSLHSHSPLRRLERRYTMLYGGGLLGTILIIILILILLGRI